MTPWRKPVRIGWWAPLAAAGLVLGALLWWATRPPPTGLMKRVPGTDHAPTLGQAANPIPLGRLIVGNGEPAPLPGHWPQFRGPHRTGISSETVTLARAWESGQPRVLWSVTMGEGYAGPVVRDGRMYVMDYDRESGSDAMRCLSLADGREIWRFAYPVPVKRNHGMSRTVPAVTETVVAAMGPKCHVVCLDARSGALKWGLDLVRDFGATVPPWYAGQCVLIENGLVILAPGGPDALLMAVDAESGEIHWRTPNPRGWKMTHSSIMAIEFGGRRQYVYCADQGVVGVAAEDGSLLWETGEWRISIATVPSPVPLPDGRIFLTGGYNAGSLMLRLQANGGRIVPVTEFRLSPEVFGATQQTPILFGDHLYGVRADGKFTCLTLDGRVSWTSPPGVNFGLGPFLLANGLIFALNDTGWLRLLAASPERYHELARARVLTGHEAWGPMALAGGRLLARDFTQLVCLEVAAP